jgi:hypothetical protein
MKVGNFVFTLPDEEPAKPIQNAEKNKLEG